MRTKNEDQCLFLVYFAQKSVTLHALKNIKSIMSVVVKWSSYIASKKGPPQCNNCQLYGHGNRNCHLLPRCLLCAGKHNKASCPSAKDINFVPICSLCGANHNSNNPAWPKRAEYIAMRKTTSQRKMANIVSPSMYTQHNQQSSNTNVSTANQLRQQPPQPAPTTSTSLVPPSTSVNRSQTTYASIVSPQPILPNNEELITNLSSCKTRSEQFLVVSNLAFKFVYPNHGP